MTIRLAGASARSKAAGVQIPPAFMPGAASVSTSIEPSGKRALAAMAALKGDQELFALTLAWTGARVSEVLALFPSSFQIEALCRVDRDAQASANSMFAKCRSRRC